MQRVIIIMGLVIAATLIIAALVGKGWLDCVVGQKSCEDDGYYWICETCGSETCWIFTGEKCK
jgi:Zn finger protein HypA/HybF involved in hydrogenase expression